MNVLERLKTLISLYAAAEGNLYIRIGIGEQVMQALPVLIELVEALEADLSYAQHRYNVPIFDSLEF